MLATLLLALALDKPTLPFAEKYDAAFAEARARNVPVLIVDFDGWTEDQQQSQPGAFYSDPQFLAQVEGAVVLLASQHDHGARKETIAGEERDVCSLWGGISCNAHRDILPKLFADFGKDGELITPLFVVATPERKELTRHEHEKRPVDLVLALKAASKHLGPGMSRTHYLQIESGLRQLRRLTELHEFAAATALLETLKKVPGNFAPNAEVKAAESALDGAGREQAKRAQELWTAKRHLEALTLIDDVKAAFGKLPCVTAASATLAEWEKDPLTKEHAASLKAHRAARLLYFQAVAYEQANDRKRATETLDKLLRQFPESEFIDRARSLRDGLKSGG